MMQSLMGAYLDAVANQNVWLLEDILILKDSREPWDSSDIFRFVLLDMAREHAEADLKAAVDWDEARVD
jgi:hypothetical protein